MGRHSKGLALHLRLVVQPKSEWMLPRLLSNLKMYAVRSWPQLARLLWRWLWFCMAGASLSSCAWLDAKQRLAVYRPTPGIPAEFPGLRPVDARYFLDHPYPADGIAGTTQAPCTTCAPQRIEMWWLPHAKPDAPVVLYCHGTFRNLYQNLAKIDALRHAGFAVLAVEYRGWGQSSSIVPSEASILQDARLAWQDMGKRGIAPGKRYIYGHSMGSGVAVDLAHGLRHGQDYAGLILESAFTSFPDVARTAGWFAAGLARFSRERFDSIAKIKQVDAPLLMIHGTQDDTIPMPLGERLFAAANPPKTWLAVPGAGHSDAQAPKAGVLAQEDAYQQALRRFVQSTSPR